MVDERRTQFWGLMRVVRANMTELERLAEHMDLDLKVSQMGAKSKERAECS